MIGRANIAPILPFSRWIFEKCNTRNREHERRSTCLAMEIWMAWTLVTRIFFLLLEKVSSFISFLGYDNGDVEWMEFSPFSESGFFFYNWKINIGNKCWNLCFWCRDVRKQQEGISGNNRLNAHTQVPRPSISRKKRGNIIFSREEVGGERFSSFHPLRGRNWREGSLSRRKRGRRSSSRGQVRANKEGRRGSSSTRIWRKIWGEGRKDIAFRQRRFPPVSFVSLAVSLYDSSIFPDTHTHTRNEEGQRSRGEARQKEEKGRRESRRNDSWDGLRGRKGKEKMERRREIVRRLPWYAD